jgi:hypothetical protein
LAIDQVPAAEILKPALRALEAIEPVMCPIGEGYDGGFDWSVHRQIPANFQIPDDADLAANPQIRGNVDLAGKLCGQSAAPFERISLQRILSVLGTPSGNRFWALRPDSDVFGV